MTIRTLGICSRRTTADAAGGLNRETSELIREGRALFDRVVVIDPREVAYLFPRGASRPEIRLHDEDLTAVDLLIVRSTTGLEDELAVLAHALAACGCRVADPLDRFTPNGASKLLSTIDRFRRGVGSTTLLAFSPGAALRLLDRVAERGEFPLVAKPAAGRRGRGVVLLRDVDEARRHVRERFAGGAGRPGPFLAQPYIAFESEYRVLVVDGAALGVVRKIAPEGALAANVECGARLEAVSAPEIERFAVASVDAVGILGVDVGRDRDGGLHVIEANRAPMWRGFADATGRNVAREILERLGGRRSTE